MEGYGAQPPIEILRQFLDQGGWYDLENNDHTFRKFVDCLLITAMGPPGGGKSYITPRMQRHLNVVSFIESDDAILNKIFRTILNWYFTTKEFNLEI